MVRTSVALLHLLEDCPESVQEDPDVEYEQRRLRSGDRRWRSVQSKTNLSRQLAIEQSTFANLASSCPLCTGHVSKAYTNSPPPPNSQIRKRGSSAYPSLLGSNSVLSKEGLRELGNLHFKSLVYLDLATASFKRIGSFIKPLQFLRTLIYHGRINTTDCHHIKGMCLAYFCCFLIRAEKPSSI